MHTPQSQAELRPTDTVAARPPSPDDPFVPDPEGPVLLLRLRRSGRAPIPPDFCKVKECPVCQWRRDGLIPPIEGGDTYPRPWV